MENIKISLCIPTMNRFDSFLNNYLKNYLDYLEKNIIDEIVICDENGEDYNKIVTSYNEFIKNHNNFKVYKNDEILGVFKNKMKVCSLAKNKYIALIDSDNFCDETYFITTKKYILENENNISKHFILSPSFAKPRFNYKHFENLVVTKSNLKNYYHVHMFEVLLNTGNYIISSDIINNITYNDYNSVMHKVSACDVIFFNLLAFQQFEDFQLHIIKDLEYEHVVHDGSTYINTIHNCQEFSDTLVKTGYNNIINNNN
jgi:hypothetical protein